MGASAETKPRHQLPLLRSEEGISIGVIEDRRSIRLFSEREVSDAVLRDILFAGQRAPSPKNRQPWYFLISRRGANRAEWTARMDRSVRTALERNPERKDLVMALESVEILRKAPVVIFVCYRSGMAEPHDDGVDWPISAADLEVVDLLSVGAAVENMLLKAEELGLGGLWCGDILYAYQDLMKCFPVSYPMVSAVCLGYPVRKPPSVDRLPLSQCCFFLENPPPG